MKVNILFTIKEMAARRASAPVGAKDLHVRATGRTTGIAMAAIGLAMQEGNHCMSFSIPSDHYGTGSCLSKAMVAVAMKDIVARLGLEGFTFNNETMTYSYQVIYEV